MEIAALPANEQDRLKAINEYYILDTLPEDDFDDITRLASEICHTPISMVSIIDANRQWFKAKHGFEASEISRDSAFCSHTINFPGEIFVVNDLSKDARFKDNPLVTGSPHVLFYVGIPLVTPEGFAIGTLSVWDRKPGTIDTIQLRTLQALANQVVTQLELRKKIMQLDKNEAELKRAYADLEKFAVIASHDLKSPLNNIISITNLMKDEFTGVLNTEGNEYLNYINSAAFQLSDMVTGILNYSRSSQIITEEKENVVIADLLEEVVKLLNAPANCCISYKKDKAEIYTSRIALKQILLNLLLNAIRHNDKPKMMIDVTVSEDISEFTFEVKDNGTGIAEKDQQKIFDLFETLNHKTPENTGIGLSVVKRLIEKLGGAIHVASELSVSTTFTFTIPK